MYERDKKELEAALRLREEEDENCNFTTGDFFKHKSTSGDGVPSIFFIHGLGKISSPVSCKDVDKLKTFAESLVNTVEMSYKGTWHIDGLYVDKQKSQLFGGTVLPNLASSFVNSLMCLDDKFFDMEIQLENLLLYGCGGPIKQHQGDVKPLIDDHIFGRMVLQVPVENGCEGGRLKVTSHTGNSKCFNFSRSSHHLYHATVFLANCHHEFEPITKGCMLTMTFILTWKNTVWIPPISSLFAFFRALTVTEKIITRWANKKEEAGKIIIKKEDEEVACLAAGFSISSSKSTVTDAANTLPPSSDENAISCPLQVEDFLFFPLDEKYTRESLSFFNLLGRDRLLYGVFQSINNIDLYLAFIDEVSNGRYLKIKDAVTADGCLPRKEFHLDAKSQLIGDSLPILESQVSKNAILIVQSRLQSVKTAYFDKFDDILDHLEITSSSFMSSQCRLTRRNLITTLEQVFSFCGTNPLRVWKDSTSSPTKRLFNICRNMRSKEAGLALLDLMCTDFTLNADGKVMDRNQVTIEEVYYIHNTKEDTQRQQNNRDSDTSESEDDDSMSCSFCSELLGKRFAISCDKCFSWYHGKCVGVTRGVAIELMEEQLDWICSKCARLESTSDCQISQQDRRSSMNICKEDTTSIPEQTESTLFYEGVRNEETAIALVEFLCEIDGWIDCAQSILKLFSSTRLPDQLTSLTSLVRQLLLRSSLQGAIHTANRLSYLLVLYDKPMKLNHLQVIDYVNLMMDLEENAITAFEKRTLAAAALIDKRKPFQKCQILINLHEKDKIGTTPARQNFYQMLCNLLLESKLHTSRRVATMVPQLVNCFQSLEDPSMFQRLMKKLCFDQACCFNILQPLLSSPNIWQQTAVLGMLTTSYPGRVALISVVNSLTLQLKCRDNSEENFRQDLISCVFLAFYIILEDFEMPANLKHLDSLSDLYSKLSYNRLINLIQDIVQIIKQNPLKKPSAPQLLELCQELLKRNGPSISASLLEEVAQVFQRQDRAIFHKFVHLLVKFDFDSKDLSIFNKLLTLMDITTEANLKWSKSYVLLLETWITNVRQSLKRNNCRSEIADCVLMFIRTEEHMPNLKCNPMDSCVNLFHLMFGDMSAVQLGQLIADIHQSQSHRLKNFSISFDMFQCLCFLFADRDLKSLFQTVSDVLISVMKAFFWLDTNSSVELICAKICSISPFGSDIPVVKQLLFSTEIQNLVISSESISKNAFYLLLDQRISYLRFCMKPKYSWMQPNAVFPNCLKFQDFLRSPLERKTFYLHPNQKDMENIVEQLNGTGCSVRLQLPNSIQTKQSLLVVKNEFSKQLQDISQYETELNKLTHLRRRLLESSEIPNMDTPGDAVIKSTLKNIYYTLNCTEASSTYSTVNEVDQGIFQCFQIYVIRNEKELVHPLSRSIELFSPIFENMSALRLAQLLVKIHQQSKVSRTPDSNEFPATLSFYSHIAQQFVKKDMKDFLKSGNDTIVDVMESLLWLDGGQFAIPFSRAICNYFPLEQENPIVTKMVMSSKLRKIAVDCHDSREAFCCLLNQRINRLKKMKVSDRDGTLKNENQVKEMFTLLRSLQDKSESEGFSQDFKSTQNGNKIIGSGPKRARLNSI